MGKFVLFHASRVAEGEEKVHLFLQRPARTRINSVADEMTLPWF